MLWALENYRMHPTGTNSRLVARRRAIEEGLKRYEEAESGVKGLVERCSAIVSINPLGRILRGQRGWVGRTLSDNPIMILTLLGSGGDMLRLGGLEEYGGLKETNIVYAN